MLKGHQLPPNYSERDRRRRDEIMDEFRTLEMEYRKRLEPLRKELAEIEASYAPRYILNFSHNADNGKGKGRDRK